MANAMNFIVFYYIGVRVTSGIRYILAGFVNFGARIQDNALNINSNLTTLNFDHSYYDAQYDGYAASAGFMNGDIIVGLDMCEYALDNEEIVNQTTVDVHSSSSLTGVKRRLVSINESVSQELWKSITSSCERLLPNNENVTMVVSRRV